MKVFMIATTANSATTATSAITANSATTAISATTANSATTAISATTADKAVKDGDGNNIVSTYLAKTHANASGTTAITSFGHVRIVTGDVSTISAVTNGSAAASFHNHDGKYSTTGHTHNASAITGGTLNIARIPTGTGSTQVALGNHTHTRTISTGTSKYYLLGWTDKTDSSSSMTMYTSSTDVYMTDGNLYVASDERLKDFVGDIDVQLNDVKRIPKKYYTWKDDKNKNVQIGTSAQKLKEIYPELVSEDENGKLAVSYEKLSVIALSAIDKLCEENQLLKDRLSKIEKLLNIE